MMAKHSAVEPFGVPQYAEEEVADIVVAGEAAETSVEVGSAADDGGGFEPAMRVNAMGN
jgi:hypothetical protein